MSAKEKISWISSFPKELKSWKRSSALNITCYKKNFCQHRILKIITRICDPQKITIRTTKMKFNCSCPEQTLLSPLVIGQGHGSDSSIASWVSKEAFEVPHLPDHDNAIVPTCEQILSIPTQLDGLGAEHREICQINVCAARTSTLFLSIKGFILIAECPGRLWYQHKLLGNNIIVIWPSKRINAAVHISPVH